jgi:hypothetical protein
MKCLLFFLILNCELSVVNAQSTFNSNGTSKSIAGNTYEYSIGEPITQTAISPSIVLTQGVLQPSIFKKVSIEYVVNNISTSIYPNPVVDYLNISIKNLEDNEIEYRLMDVSGKELIHQNLSDESDNVYFTIPMDIYASGIYHLSFIIKRNNQIISQTIHQIVKQM